jgi:hypothetical protein
LDAPELRKVKFPRSVATSVVDAALNFFKRSFWETGSKPPA